jgi:hypothetical protein
MKRIINGIAILISIGVAPVQLCHAQSGLGAVDVPVVGCPSNGQQGPLPLPKLKSARMTLSSGTAQRLAYYLFGAGRGGVLAPRGWHCFGTYGSSGSALFVAPEAFRTDNIFFENWTGFTGAVIELSISSGGTSGRFAVAQVIARVFPEYRAFVHRVISEGIEPASDFPFGPMPSDTLRYLNDHEVEFRTAANSPGLGTRGKIRKNGDPIEGAVLLVGEDTDLWQLSLRLPHGSEDLAKTVTRQFEHEAFPNKQ